MASGPSSSSAGPLLPSVLKCAACRTTLQNVQPPKEDADTRGSRGSKELIPVVEEDSMPVPRWIQEKIDEVTMDEGMISDEILFLMHSLQSGWTKGKISCPHCSARIGGFDFVGGSVSSDFPIYLVRSKVDVHTPKDLQQLMTESREANWPPRIATVATDESEQGNTAGEGACGTSFP